MNLLLDTHILLWWDWQSNDLGPRAWAAIEDPANAVHVSAASIWEIAIKRRVGKLAFDGSAAAAIAANGFQSLPIQPTDSEAAGDLPWQHNDPFDRMLVAQALRFGLTLVTIDGNIRNFPGLAVMWGG